MRRGDGATGRKREEKRENRIDMGNKVLYWIEDTVRHCEQLPTARHCERSEAICQSNAERHCERSEAISYSNRLLRRSSSQ